MKFRQGLNPFLVFICDERKIMNEDIIIRFLQGSLSESEEQLFYNWLESNAKHKKLFHEIKAGWALSKMTSENQAFDPGNELYIFKKRIADKIKSRKSISLYKNLLRIAAVVILLLGIEVIYSKLNFSTQHAIKGAYNEISTNAGEKSKITLADGSQIWMNACTKLRYPSDLNSGKLDIYLEGEAYFDLKKVKGRKITVHTSEININVLGTAFNLRDYADEDIIETTYIRGQITIERKSGSNGKSNNLIELHPSQSASFIKDNRKSIVKEFTRLDVKQHENEDEIKEITF